MNSINTNIRYQQHKSILHIYKKRSIHHNQSILCHLLGNKLTIEYLHAINRWIYLTFLSMVLHI